MAQKFGRTPISLATKTDILTNGEQTYDRILKAIATAKHHIHLEYYIVRSDEIGSRLKDLLIQKAEEGVSVRFLYDAVGSWLLPHHYRQALADAGVQIVPFFPVKLPFLNHRVNFRNHRKIVVVDGDIGFIGGLNVGDEYLGKSKTYGFWRDTHLLIEGETVRSLQLYFLQDWLFMTGESLAQPQYFSPKAVEGDMTGGVQMIASGPDSEWESIKQLFLL